MTQTFLASLTRIADLDKNPVDYRPLDRSEWESGDYVMTEVTGERSDLYIVETRKGEMLPVKAGDRILFGKYAGTDIKLDGVEHVFMREDDILSIVE